MHHRLERCAGRTGDEDTEDVGAVVVRPPCTRLVEQRQCSEPAEPLVGFRGHLGRGRSGADPELVHRLHQRLREGCVEVHAQTGAERQDVVHGDRAFGGDRLAVDRAERVDEHASIGELGEQRVDGIVEAEEVLLHQDQRRHRRDGLGDRRDAEEAVGCDRRVLAAGEVAGDTALDVVAARRQPGHSPDVVGIDVVVDRLADPRDPGCVEAAHVGMTLGKRANSIALAECVPVVHEHARRAMVIVGGWFEVDPSERDAFVAAQADAIRRSRAEQGCIEYVIAADPVEPGRAVLFERWASQADLDAHLAGVVERTEVGRPAGRADGVVDRGVRRERRAHDGLRFLEPAPGAGG